MDDIIVAGPSVEEGIQIERRAVSRISEIDMNDIPFGREFSDHMLVIDYKDGKWQQPIIKPYGPLPFPPAMSALNYGQAIFEGMKAYRGNDGDIRLFRAGDNLTRLNRSAERMCMPNIPEDLFMQGLSQLLSLDKDWVPKKEQGTLYIRPLMYATDDYIGVKSSDNYQFVIFTCPVGMYYKDPVNLLVTKEFVRAAIGGTGAAKAAGNYAAAMLPDKIAKSQGYHNILWLDGRDHLYIEECGTMNVFFVVGDTVLTPRLGGTILPGITRKSVLRLLRDNGYKVEVRRISIHEIEEAYEEGLLTETFGTGTAASIAHVNMIGFQGKQMFLPEVSTRKIGPWLSDTLNAIKHGEIEDPYGWVTKL